MGDVVCIAISTLLSAYVLLLTMRASTGIRGFLLILSVSMFFYCSAGPLYWIVERNSVFLGLDWKGQIGFSSVILATSSAILATTTWIFDKNNIKKYIFNQYISVKNDWIVILLTIGFLGGLYVLAGSFIFGLNMNSKDSLFLIAYQFSDVLIPVFLYKYFSAVSSKRKFLYFFLYIVFAVLVGFRYKLALFIGAVVVYYVIRAGRFGKSAYIKSMVKTLFLGLMVVAFLGTLTLIRKPFNGVDVSELNGVETDDAMYGVFAESNVIFALSTVITEFTNKDIYYYTTPYSDAILEFIPRFLYKDRQTGAYLLDVMEAMKEPTALASGTAYPYIGELLLAGGWVGLLIGLVMITLWIRWCIDFINNENITEEIKIGGYSIVAVYFGYYFFSRGYFPQSFKGFIFVVAPYLFLCKKTKLVFLGAR